MATRVNIAQPDITLTLGLDGIIRAVNLSSAIDEDAGLTAWLGRPWAETVDEAGGGEKVQRMLEDARANGVSAFRQLTQRFPSGRELPIEYTLVRLGGRAGLLAVGKNLQAVAELQARLIAAQHAREQDYWKLREIETRSRLLFDASSEAVLIIRSDTFGVIEANPSAIRQLGVAPGWDVMREIAPRDRDAVHGMLRRAREQGRAPGILVHLGSQETPWTLRASLMTASEPGPVFLLQFSSTGAEPHAAAETAGATRALAYDALIEALPDAFLVLNGQGQIRRANRAFLDLVQVAAEGSVIGERVSRWVGRPGADIPLLLSTLTRHGTARLFPTGATGEFGAETEVEISAVAQGEAEQRRIGLLVRDIGRRLDASAPAEDMLRRALGAMTTQVGRTPLTALVRETTGLVERQCIEAALDLANGRRTVAAELLGLSRQSLYAKLDRYGIGAADTGAESRDQEAGA